jgi:hypothetical protein
MFIFNGGNVICFVLNNEAFATTSAQGHNFKATHLIMV